jgi:hypothetical protein
MFPERKRWFLDDSRGSPRSKGATRRRSTCRHGQARTGKIAKAIGQKCEQPWGNQGFGTERTGFEQPAKSLGNTGVPKRGDAKSDPRRKTGNALVTHADSKIGQCLTPLVQKTGLPNSYRFLRRLDGTSSSNSSAEKYASTSRA